MNSHQITKYIAPHQHPEKKNIIRYLEYMMRLTFDHPLFVRDLLHITGASSFALILSPLVLSMSPLTKVAAVVAGVAGASFTAINLLAQHTLFGFPVPADFQAYHAERYELKDTTGVGEMIVEPGHLPLLKIKARDHYSAGYIEGRMLAPAMSDILKHMQILFPVLGMAYGVSGEMGHWPVELQDVLKHVPDIYIDEMKGKVAGYNDSLGVNDEPLTFEKYFLLQLLPDFRNTELFPKYKFIRKLVSLYESMACTTFVLRLHDQTFFNRKLDWPSHDVAGKYICQIEREIDDIKPTCDVSMPLASGGLTISNRDGLLIQINVANGPRESAALGMPAILFNRYCAENASNVQGIDAVLKKHQPFGAYHMTVSDGEETKSFHFYQSMECKGEHVVESLRGLAPDIQVMVVANQGVRFKGEVAHVKNYRDSLQRIENLQGFFQFKPIRDELELYLKQLQRGEKLTDEVVNRITDLCHQAARLPLVSNMESVLFAQYHFDGKHLRSAKVATNNLFVAERKPEEFKLLKR